MGFFRSKTYLFFSSWAEIVWLWNFSFAGLVADKVFAFSFFVQSKESTAAFFSKNMAPTELSFSMNKEVGYKKLTPQAVFLYVLKAKGGAVGWGLGEGGILANN